MTDRNKFEEMLERLVNEDRAGAEELFHEIVVEKSREIYQSIIESENEDEDLDEADDEDLDEADDDKELEESADEDDEDLDEAADEDDEDLDEMFGLDEFAPGDGSDKAMGMGGDATDDMIGDVGMDDMDGMDAEGDTDERLDRLEDAFEELEAQFQELMAGEEDEPEHSDMDFDSEESDDEEDEEDEEDEDDKPNFEKESFAFEAKKKEDKKEKKTAGEEMREYVEKVGGAQYNQFGKMGDNGQNTKSIVASKNDMGGTSQNILRADTEQGVEANKGQIKGSSLIKQKPQDMKTGNINVPGGKASNSWKSNPKGHGAEKKGAGETADKGAVSTLTKVSSRAK